MCHCFRALFQSTLPARGATEKPPAAHQPPEISIHAPRTGSDSRSARHSWRKQHFNPRSPHGERQETDSKSPFFVHFNPRSPHGERLMARTLHNGAPRISIHAPRTGSDSRSARHSWRKQHFNPRSPHGERQETDSKSPFFVHFNPRSPHGERRASASRATRRSSHFNPRSPHGERPTRIARYCCAELFQSTLPARGATTEFLSAPRDGEISIHAPRTGSDHGQLALDAGGVNFNPRSPHGERHTGPHSTNKNAISFQSTLPARGATVQAYRDAPEYIQFQSTLPARGATFLLLRRRVCLPISIHAPRTGSDGLGVTGFLLSKDFNPRSPHGERRNFLTAISAATHFNPRSPHGERPRHLCQGRGRGNFNPRSPHGERRRAVGIPDLVQISIHAPRTGSDCFKSQGSPRRDISIHAPRTGSDGNRDGFRPCAYDFNPRSPHGERLRFC